MSQVPTRTVRNGDVELAVFESGNPDGPVVVTMHGWPDTHHLWDRATPLLADRFRVVAFDNRGAGASSVPAEVAAFRLEELAGDLFAVIDAVSPDAPVHVLAHDWGSIAVWEALADDRATDRIASFTSISGPDLDQLGAWLRRMVSSGRPRDLVKVGRQAVASSYTVAFQIPGLPVPALKFLAPRWPRFLSVFDGLDPSVVHAADTLPSDIVSCLKLYRANIRNKLRRPRAQPTAVPVQVLVGTHDRAILSLLYDETDGWASSVRRRDIAAGHWSPISHPADVARLTTEFVDDVTAARPAAANSL